MVLEVGLVMALVVEMGLALDHSLVQDLALYLM